nr:lipoprotein signal peptidase [Neisseria sp. HSC-16F19]
MSPLQNLHLRRISVLEVYARRGTARSLSLVHDMSALAALLRLELHPQLKVFQRSQSVATGCLKHKQQEKT